MSVDVKAVVPVGPPAAACCAPTTNLDPALDADRLAELASALSEPIRIQILDVLRRHAQPLCQCELLALFGIPQPTLSHHVSKLVRSGLVTIDRRHRWAYYSVSPDALKELSTWLS